jgi:hypothetical protein
VVVVMAVVVALVAAVVMADMILLVVLLALAIAIVPQLQLSTRNQLKALLCKAFNWELIHPIA